MVRYMDPTFSSAVENELVIWRYFKWLPKAQYNKFLVYATVAKKL